MYYCMSHEAIKQIRPLNPLYQFGRCIELKYIGITSYTHVLPAHHLHPVHLSTLPRLLGQESKAAGAAPSLQGFLGHLAHHPHAHKDDACVCGSKLRERWGWVEGGWEREEQSEHDAVHSPSAGPSSGVVLQLVLGTSDGKHWHSASPLLLPTPAPGFLARRLDPRPHGPWHSSSQMFGVEIHRMPCWGMYRSKSICIYIYIYIVLFGGFAAHDCMVMW